MNYGGESYYDDNFGQWDDMHDPDVQDFYHRVQRESVVKTCEGCKQTVRLMPQYAYCDSCATKIERGYDL